MADEFKFFTNIAFDLEHAGLSWVPSIGDEVCLRKEPNDIKVLVDPQALKAEEIKEYYLWLPSFEQMVSQLEVRQGVLAHAGLELTPSRIAYVTVIDSRLGKFESSAKTLRNSMGLSFRDFLLYSTNQIQ